MLRPRPCSALEVPTGSDQSVEICRRPRPLKRMLKSFSILLALTGLAIHILSSESILIEEAPTCLTSDAGYMMRHFLRRAGYTVEARVLDPRGYGELTGRRRSVIVAHSGSNFQWPEPLPAAQTFASIRDDESTL